MFLRQRPEPEDESPIGGGEWGVVASQDAPRPLPCPRWSPDQRRPSRSSSIGQFADDWRERGLITDSTRSP